MDNQTVLLFTRNGMGDADPALQKVLVEKFLSLTLDANQLPAQILFYTEGVKLACEGSNVINQLKQLESRGVELILCKTCLDYFGLAPRVQAGIVGGMTDIIEALSKAGKVISL